MKLTPVCCQLDFDRLVWQYYVWFAEQPILIAEEPIDLSSWWMAQ